MSIRARSRGRGPIDRASSPSRRFPLAVKVGVPLVLIGVATAALVGWGILRETRDRLMGESFTRARSIALLVARRFPLADRESMNDFLGQIQTVDPLIRRITVFRDSEEGVEVWASTEPSAVLVTIGADATDAAVIRSGRPVRHETVRDGNHLLEVVQPLRVGGSVVGAAGIELSLDELDAAVARSAREALVLTSSIMVAALALVMALMYQLVLRRAGRLARAAERVAGGDLSVRLPEGSEPRGRDELFNVAHEFDRMLRSVQARTRQQAAVAELGQRALSGADVPALLEETVRLVASGLGVEYGSVLQHREDGFLFRAGVGWSEGVVGATVPAASQAGYTIELGEPVLVTDLHTEDRFPVSPVMRAHDMRSAATAVIPGADGPFGVLGAHTTEPRTFSPDDLHFLRSMANSLGWAIQHRQARVRLAEAEARYRDLVERIPAVTYVAEFGFSGRWQYVSPQIESILGFPRKQWLDDAGLWYRQLHPEDRSRAIGDEERSRESGEPLTSEYRVHARDGRVVWFRDEAVVVRTEGGGPLLQGVMYDITEQKEAEQALSAAYEREREVAERLRSVDEMKNAFLSAVSHELRTPLASVIGFARTLQEHGKGLPPEEHSGMLDRLVVNALKLERLLSDLLDLDRLARGIVEPRRQLVDVGALARRVAADTDTRGRTVRVRAETVEIRVDPSQVERIIENLLVNAAKHTPEGTAVHLGVSSRGEGALILVEDEGAGVPDDLKEEVFQPFMRGLRSVEHAPGTGIGLSLVARFAELHGGRAWVEDRPGGGASFRVFLADATGGPERSSGMEAITHLPDPGRSPRASAGTL
jgi:PAS domain S-box-containing protein